MRKTADLNRVMFVVALLFVAVLSGCGRTQGDVGLAPGNLPPDLKLPSLDDPGKELSLRDFKGKAVLLNFWASWCAPCVAEMPELEKLYETLSPKGFSVVAVGVEDSPENLAKVKKRFNLQFPILVDRKGLSKSAYKLSGFPESFALGKDGTLTMVPDPESNQPVVRFIGPRVWSGESALSVLGGLATR